MSILRDHPMLRSLKETFKAQQTYVEGTVYHTVKGFGFLQVSKNERYFVPEEEMKCVAQGDKVRGMIVTINGRNTVKLCELLSTELTRLIGRLSLINDKWYVLHEIGPSHLKLEVELPHTSQELNLALQEGNFVAGELSQHPLSHGKAKDLSRKKWKVKLTSIVAQSREKWAHYKAALAQFNLPISEPGLLNASFDLKEIDEVKRVDLTHLPFVTIDGASTQDMDDAIFAEEDQERPGNYCLYVAIADPTAFLSTDSPLIQEASERGFSVYLPGFSVPLLPRVLSESLCSLRADQDRKAVVCSVSVTPTGALAEDSVQFFLGSIRSSARLSYEECSNWFEGVGSSAVSETNSLVQRSLLALETVTERLRKFRLDRSAELFGRVEYRFVLDEQGKVIHVTTEKKRTAHRVVEEAMVAANMCCAKFLSSRLGKGVFSAHSGLNPKEKESLKELISHFKLKESDLNACYTLEGYQNLKKLALQTKNAYFHERLKQMQQAGSFSIKPVAHFGLGLSEYATWTSPMRKYGDLLNHRLLKSALLQEDDTSAVLVNLDVNQLRKLEAVKKRARLMEKQVHAELYKGYLKSRIGEKFTAYVLKVGTKGIRVRLEENGAECFLSSAQIKQVSPDFELDPLLGVVTYKGKPHVNLGSYFQVLLEKIHAYPRLCGVKLSLDTIELWRTKLNLETQLMPFKKEGHVTV